MKIVSNYKDVYDSMNMYGIDEKNVFLRMPIVYQIKKDFVYKKRQFNNQVSEEFSKISEWYHSDFSANEDLIHFIEEKHYSYRLVGGYFKGLPSTLINKEGLTDYLSFKLGFFLFCGQLIPCILSFKEYEFSGFKINFSPEGNPSVHELAYFSPTDVFYPKETLEETESALFHWMSSITGDKELTKWLEVERYQKSGFQKTLNFLMKNRGDNQGMVNDILKKMNVSYLFCVVENPMTVIIYPSLKELKFTKHMDVMKMYQEISMHQGALAHDPNPPVEIEDKYKQAAKGFGHKYAFKKRKSK